MSKQMMHVVLREKSACDISNDYDGRLGLRISSVFVVLFGSTCGALLPILISRMSKYTGFGQVFFIFKYFGSGVIIATAYIHLLAPAIAALTNPCLHGAITEYDWVEGIILMSIFGLFFVEILLTRYGKLPTEANHSFIAPDAIGPMTKNYGQADPGTLEPDPNSLGKDYAVQIAAILILEFGVIFHSVFIGLTLAVSGKEFVKLYIVIVFHQTFEGLGLGSRLALTPWPRSKAYTPYVLAVAYGITTPIAISIGLVLQSAYPPSAETTLIANGIFDSISAGILIYVGCVELMAQEILRGSVMLDSTVWTMLSAFGLMSLGAGLMALLGKWV